MLPAWIDHTVEFSRIKIVGWVERSETRRNTASGAHGGFRCALPRRPHPPYNSRFFIQPNHLDGLQSLFRPVRRADRGLAIIDALLVQEAGLLAAVCQRPGNTSRRSELIAYERTVSQHTAIGFDVDLLQIRSDTKTGIEALLIEIDIQ
jgi:hypothetical protein